MNNPLLESHQFPPFAQIIATGGVGSAIETAIDSLIAKNRAGLENLLEKLEKSGESPTWDNLVAPLEAADDELNQAWSPVSHMNAVVNSPELREVYNRCIGKLTEYGTEIGQHTGLYSAYRRLADSESYRQLNEAQRKTIDNALRDFRLAGVALEKADKKRFGDIKKRLSELSSQFSNNVLDATQGWYKHVTDENPLGGLPQTALDNARQSARDKGLEGFAITLDIPAYLAVMMHADDRALRGEVYRAYVTRASELGMAMTENSAEKWDNGPIIDEILSLRSELAQLLDFENYAELSLATKMAESTSQVMKFLLELAEKSLPMATTEYTELAAFAAEKYGIDILQAWDVAYFSEKLRQQKYAVSQEELRPYFPVSRVIDGLFQVAGRLFAIDLETVTQSAETGETIETWHPDVRVYRILREGKTLAYFYLDLFARDNKRGGAWMDVCRVRRLTPRGMQLPVAYLVCNFTPPAGGKPSLLTHDEVTTLFHEFGHGLHHMLTQMECAAVSGINGVAWDAVELPSQFLENWCWEKPAIAMISGHFETGEHLPDALLDKMLAAKNFQAGMQMVRQLEFSLFDFRLHREYRRDNPVKVQGLLDEVRRQVAVVIPPEFNKFQNSFNHIFAGGYAAGYYSYKWAEVLSSDAFSLFEERGIFDSETGRRFLEEILEKGGSKDPMELYIEFRGRRPDLNALLRHNGLVSRKQ